MPWVLAASLTLALVATLASWSQWRSAPSQQAVRVTASLGVDEPRLSQLLQMEREGRLGDLEQRHQLADADLAGVSPQHVDELRHQYILGFVPASLDGKLRELAKSPDLPWGPGEVMRYRDQDLFLDRKSVV